jgi:hypothetical protein
MNQDNILLFGSIFSAIMVLLWCLGVINEPSAALPSVILIVVSYYFFRKAKLTTSQTHDNKSSHLNFNVIIHFF